jgi:maleamate amidohydrolase
MRVWDHYLSERDQVQLERLGPLARRGFGSSAALLMVDHCNYGLGREPLPLLESMEKYPLSFGLEGWAAVQETQILLEACRKMGVPVVYTVPHGFGPHSPRHVAGGMDGIVGDDVWSREIVKMLAPVEGEVVLQKAGASSFAGTPLDAILCNMHIDTLLVTGNSTSGCVRATVVDAAYLRFHTIVVEECVYDRVEAAHCLNLFDMHQKYADVLSNEEVLRWLPTTGLCT